MKKLISIIGAIGMCATTSLSVVSCGNEPKNKSNSDSNNNSEDDSSKFDLDYLMNSVSKTTYQGDNDEFVTNYNNEKNTYLFTDSEDLNPFDESDNYGCKKYDLLSFASASFVVLLQGRFGLDSQEMNAGKDLDKYVKSLSNSKDDIMIYNKKQTTPVKVTTLHISNDLKINIKNGDYTFYVQFLAK